jgi:DnaA regulatory inactivator Hda
MSRQYPLPLPHREAMDADDFIVADSNREAVAWIDRWPGWNAPAMALHGPTGSGKTHLMQVWRTRSRARLVTPTDLGTLQFDRPGQSMTLAIDDADRIAGDARAEETLFHLYNRLGAAKGTLLLAATQPPAHWPIKLPDLRSRLASIPAVAIAPPDDALLAALLVKQFRDRQIEIGPELVDFLLPRIERSAGFIRAFATALDRASLAEGRGVTVALARKLLEEQAALPLKSVSH